MRNLYSAIRTANGFGWNNLRNRKYAMSCEWGNGAGNRKSPDFMNSMKKTSNPIVCQPYMFWWLPLGVSSGGWVPTPSRSHVGVVLVGEYSPSGTHLPECLDIPPHGKDLGPGILTPCGQNPWQMLVGGKILFFCKNVKRKVRVHCQFCHFTAVNDLV